MEKPSLRRILARLEQSAEDKDQQIKNYNDEQGVKYIYNYYYYRVAKSSNGLTIWQLHLQHWLLLNLMIIMMMMIDDDDVGDPHDNRQHVE